MKDKQNYTAYCNDKKHIMIANNSGDILCIDDKDVAISLAHSILAAVDEDWDEDLIIHNGDALIAIHSDGLCHDCYFFNKGCDDIKCQSHDRKDSRDVYWKLKDEK